MTIDDIFASRESFDMNVYTPWEEALRELDARAGNAALDAYVAKQLPHGLPEVMQGKKSMVLFRHIATPNYEINRFFIAADALDRLQPLILEYTADKFTNRNEWKYFLGRIPFHKGMSKNGEAIYECRNIIDFNTNNNKPICDIQTSWGERLVDFHHGMFDTAFPHLKDNKYDLSEWLHTLGGSARDYYKGFLSLFLKDAILFENFLIDGKELSFTKEVIMPAFIEIYEETGCKPLIVALEPTHIEGEQFWLSHPISRKAHIDSKLETAG